MPIIRQRQSRRFKDISLSFKRHPVTNDILALTNEDAIKRSVRNLVETVNEERFFNPLLSALSRSFKSFLALFFTLWFRGFFSIL